MSRRSIDPENIQLSPKSLAVLIITILLGMGGNAIVNKATEPSATAQTAVTQQMADDKQRRIELLEAEMKNIQQALARIETKLTTIKK